MLILLITSSCSKTETEQTQMGELSLAIDAGTITATESLSSLYISLHNEDSTVVLFHEPLTISVSDSGFVSQSLTLPLGIYIIDGIVFQNHKGETVYFSPKKGSAGATFSGKTMPETISINTTQSTVRVPAINPLKLGINPAECGYKDFPNWNAPQPPTKPGKKQNCIRIGLSEGAKLMHPVVFKLFADDSLVLAGTCSEGVTDFQVPIAQNKYRLTVNGLNGTEELNITTTQVLKYSCASALQSFIDLRFAILDTICPKKPHIVFIKQELYGSFPNHFTLMDSEGQVFKVQSYIRINESLGKAIFLIEDSIYDTLSSLMINALRTVETDTLTYFQEKFPDIEAELFEKYAPIPGPKPQAQIYAVYPVAENKYRLLMIDAYGPPKGTGWIGSESFLPLRWLLSQGF